MRRQWNTNFSDSQALTGAFVFTSDLARAMTPLPLGLAVDFFSASSYGAATVSLRHSKRIQKRFNALAADGMQRSIGA